MITMFQKPHMAIQLVEQIVLKIASFALKIL